MAGDFDESEPTQGEREQEQETGETREQGVTGPSPARLSGDHTGA